MPKFDARPPVDGRLGLWDPPCPEPINLVEEHPTGVNIVSDEPLQDTHFHIACPALYPLPNSRAAFRYIFTALDGGDCDGETVETHRSCVAPIHSPPRPPTVSTSPSLATKSISPSPVVFTDCLRFTDVAGDGDRERDRAVVHTRRDGGSTDFLLFAAPDKSAGADADVLTVRGRCRGAGIEEIDAWEEIGVE